MKWMRERDLLIAQTMAFVQSVTGKKPEAEKTNAASVTILEVGTSMPATKAAPMPDIEALLAERSAMAEAPREASREASRPVQITRPDLRSDFQSEIRARVANFRAHQERFHRERDAYCSATMDKVHAALREASQPPRLGK